jgi:hypothetical protein
VTENNRTSPIRRNTPKNDCFICIQSRPKTMSDQKLSSIKLIFQFGLSFINTPTVLVVVLVEVFEAESIRRE